MGQEIGQEQILLAPRPLTRLLREGETAIRENRFSDGIEALGTLLLEEAREDLPEDTLHQDYFNEPAQEGYYRSSVRGKALRLLGSIPEEGRKILEIQYGVSARQALAAAVAARDMEAISEVTRKYYHTEAGYDAAILLAQDKIIRGYPIAAAGILERLSSFPAARKRFGAQLAGEAAGAWMQAGRLDLAVRALEDGSKNFPGASIVLGGRQTTFDGKQEWPKLLSQVYPKQGQAGARNLDNWLMTGGQPDRNGTASVGLPMPIVAWHRTLHRDRSDEETANTLFTSRQAQGVSSLVPKLEARMIGDIVLAKTATANVFAIDLETGLLKWPFYKDALPVPITSRLQNTPDAEEFYLSNSLRNRIWGSSAFGQFTIDANHLYYITSSEDQRLAQPQLTIQRTTSPPAHNMLFGVSLQGEGKEMWQVGGTESPSEPALVNAYFLGPPLSFEGELYALVEINLETRLVVLDSRTGKQQWAQQLTLSPLTPIRSDLLRQSQALSPSISDAVIVCPIGNGAIIAVDLLTRSLLWGKQYQTTAPPNINQGFNFDNTETYDPSEDRWVEPQVVIQNGRIIFTPPETSRIMCLDLLTGESRWDQLRAADRYVAGIYKDQAIIVSNTAVHALNLSDGMPGWGSEVLLNGRSFESKEREGATTSEPSGARGREMLAGKSIRDGQFLYVPTTGQRVLKIDLEAGKLVDSAKVEQPLGNLFAFKNRLISVGATRITAYYTRESLAAEVDQRLAANPKDNWALNQKSLLLTAEGKIAEAIEILKKSYAIHPENGETRYLLVDALLAGLESDFDRYLPLATEFEPIIESQRFRFLVMLARGNLKAGQYELAFSRLMELVRERSTSRQPGLQVRLQTMTLAPGHQVDIDTWIAVHLGMVFEQAPPELKRKMLATIEERMKAAAVSHPLARQAELRFLTWLEPAHPSILTMASTLLGGADQTKAERMLQPLLYSRNEELRNQAVALMRQNAEADNKAMLSYRSASMEFGNNPLVPNESPDVAAPDVVRANVRWPNGMVEAHVSANSGPASFNQIRVRNTANRYGRGPVELNLLNDRLMITNPLGQLIGTCVFPDGVQELSDGMLRAQVDGGMVFVETVRELIALDMYRNDDTNSDPVLWRHSLSRVPISPRKPHTPPHPIPTMNVLGIRSYTRGQDREAIVGPVTPVGIVIQKETDVIMLDALTGLPLWSRGGYDATTSLVAQGLEVAVVRAENPQIDILDCRDGSLIRHVDQVQPWKSLFSSGKHLLQYKETSTVRKGPIQIETPNSCDLRLLDAFTGKLVVEASFAPSTRAESCADRFFVAMEESGRLWYCNVETGQVVEHMLDKQPKLQHVRVQQFGDRLVTWTSQQSPTSGSSMSVKPEVDDTAMARGLYAINGSIIALDANTGKLLWDRAGMLSRFVFNNSQPRNSPFIGFYRVVGAGSTRMAHLAVVDLRDGTLAYANNSLPINTQGIEGSEFTMRIDPSRSTLQLSVGTTGVTLKITETEKPPQPVCFYGALGGRKQNAAPFTPLR